ncbi:cytochrome P450 [Sphaerulina musiva SO2202]|uniref:Cytochrome P450 n=1 Tax=Sphaerulina musiva (strain SO2202) TaxID=692275 RepID=M3D794_SPHMS|nr:cytochrome P450 [Sphaerulina musiva SO2202]EMF14035.1 cytochrome P450 [Sphaerulina musiva SO2202]
MRSTGSLALILILVLGAIVVNRWQRKPKLPKVPILKLSPLPGKAGVAEDVAAFVRNGRDVMQAGYDQYSKHGQNYLLRTPWGFMLVLAPRFIQEMVWMPDDKLDNQPTHNEILQTRYTMHPTLEEDQYYLEIVQKQLTRNLGPGLPDLVDEAKRAFRGQIGDCTAWKAVGMWDAAFKITTRTANRFFFGKELASDAEFLQLAVSFSSTVFDGANVLRVDYPFLNYLPFLKPYFLAWKTNVQKDHALARTKLRPTLRARIAQLEQQEQREEQERQRQQYQYQDQERIYYGNEKKSPPNTPSDAVQWVLEITPPSKRNIDHLVHRMMHITVVAVHTSSTSYLDCMNELAAHPEIHSTLREEILSKTTTTTTSTTPTIWRKQALSKLLHLDSFMRETVRLHTNASGQLDRVAMTDVQLSDGSIIPRGTYVTVPSVAMNGDAAIWGPDVNVFDAWRFVKKRQAGGGEEGTQHSFVQTGVEYLHFG